ncbi:ReoY family proteolytic degradation factor [Carnobacterium pleistocenium]|uniref:ReoY family proteolytic degradation factor n=1 Tax=Carnobacterium pleistocenium TaxID=181073 RepID=UPI000552F275|nr:ReoY family proteolytic degradation factor [Carnobacterium pleistocenium]
MNIQISLEAKKIFLSWFLDRYQLKRRESMWILNYLLNHDIVLNKVHFVEAVEKTPRGMMMSTTEMGSEPFLFYKNGTVFSDPEQAFHEVRLNWQEEMYIELIFSNPWKSAEYLTVLEDNPYFKWNEMISGKLIEEVELALETLSLTERKQNTLHQIDLSLEEDDREKFIQLSNQLKKIEDDLKNEQKKPNH